MAEEERIFVRSAKGWGDFMVLIGLTGGIASGKSTVSQMLTELGAKVIDADMVARDVVAKGSPLLGKIAECFGEDILLADRSLNRIKLGEKIFHDDGKRQVLNDLMHPEIRKEILRQVDVYTKQSEKLVFLDIPLLFETQWCNFTQENWVVYVDSDKQVERLMKRNDLSREQAVARIQSQMRLCDKIKLADVVIDNNGDLVYTKQQVKNAWDMLGKYFI